MKNLKTKKPDTFQYQIKNLGASPRGMSRWFGRKILLKIRDKPA